MKFGKQLQVGLYGPWKQHYMNYDRLKRIISRLKLVLESQNPQTRMARAFSKGSDDDSEAEESTPFTATKKKIKKDKKKKNKEAIEALDISNRSDSIIDPPPNILDGEFFDIFGSEVNKVNSFFNGIFADLVTRVSTITLAPSGHFPMTVSASYTTVRDVYVELVALKHFGEMNREGLRKIMKKFDKNLGTDHQSRIMTNVVDTRDFVKRMPEVEDLTKRLQSVVSRDKLLEFDEYVRIRTEIDEHDISLFPSVKPYRLVCCIIAAVIAGRLLPVLEEDALAKRCLSLLTLVIGLWVSEAIPYFATALLIPPLTVLFRVLKDPTTGDCLDAESSALLAIDHMINHTTILIMGGYTISAALSRCEIELRIASMLQALWGNRPYLFLLAMMFLGLFLSMWISNHTAPVLCMSILLPIIRDFDRDCKYTKALLIGTAVACNFGGMMTPISSMQNALAVVQLNESGGVKEINFGAWVAVATPVCVIGVILAWMLIILIVEPDDIREIPKIIIPSMLNQSKKDSDVFDFPIFTKLKDKTIYEVMNWKESVSSYFRYTALKPKLETDDVDDEVTVQGNYSACSTTTGDQVSDKQEEYGKARMKPKFSDGLPLLTPGDILVLRKYLVVSLSVATIVAWTSLSYTVSWIGDLAIISLLFMGFMFGSGILTEVDFNSFSWHALFLLAGGNVLGLAVTSSGLLEYIVENVLRSLPHDNIWLFVSITCFATMIIATFVSHTVAAIVLMPLLASIGKSIGHPCLLVIACAMADSSAMSLPFSSFPNVNSFLMVDDLQKPFLSTKDLSSVAIPISFVSVLLICSIGVLLIGFLFEDILV